MTISTQNFDELAHEHRLLIQQYGQVQLGCSELIATQAAKIKQLQSQIMQLRAAVIVRDTALAYAHEDRIAFEASIPGLPKRTTLAGQVKILAARIDMLMRERLLKDAGTITAAPRPSPVIPTDLHRKSVLCIGQRTTDVGVARQMVESAGGRFLHHDDDGIDNPEALEASLVAADLVICQTGCVSHNAYWRVQDHCKRTGKQCVLIDRPQALHFVRNIQEELQAIEPDTNR
jgi:hypothetical protein